MSFLAFDRVAFGYPGTSPVLHGLDLTLPAGEFHCVVGRSGCGKTTLLKLAAGLLQPTDGRVLREGSTGIDGRQQTGFVFQSPTLLDWLSAVDNVLLPVSLRRRPAPHDRRAAEALLAQLGLDPAQAVRHPRQLSGGQQSRVALARALLLQPPLLLLDEPFAALDSITREDVQQDLLRVCREHGTTVLFVTHDLGEAVFLGDRVSVIAGGRLVRTVATDLPRPRSADLRDDAGFSRCCATVREALGRVEMAA